MSSLATINVKLSRQDRRSVILGLIVKRNSHLYEMAFLCDKDWASWFVANNRDQLGKIYYRRSRPYNYISTIPVHDAKDCRDSNLNIVPMIHLRRRPRPPLVVPPAFRRCSFRGFKIWRKRNLRSPPAYAFSLGKNFPVSIVYSLRLSSEGNKRTFRPVFGLSTRSTRLTCLLLSNFNKVVSSISDQVNLSYPFTSF
jgi:hypothetical protein